MRQLISFLLVLLFSGSVFGDISPSSGVVLVARNFERAEREFEKRWLDFGGDTQHFSLWTSTWDEEVLKARFEQLSEERWKVYFLDPQGRHNTNWIGLHKDLYKVPTNRECWHSRYVYSGSFAYNLADPCYNASLITLQGHHFLAMEAPSSGNLEIFFRVLKEYSVTDLVRLTPAIENERENSVPYWEGRTHIDSKTGRPTLMLEGREIRYYPTDLWKDHCGVETLRLLALVHSVRKAPFDEPPVVAVHCRAGIGRTGTFLAAYALSLEIDAELAIGIPLDQIKVSIDKVVWELALQRPFAITHFSQYLTLYKFVSFYLESKKS